MRRKVGIDLKTLKSIRLQNFQSHKDTLIHLAGPGCLTVITGPSDSGKSAIIRALRWVFYNVPQGDGFIMVGQDRCAVTLTFDDGTTVERIRSRGGVNRYVVNGQLFEGFGSGVPLEVQLATGIRKLEIGDQNFLLNLSEQLDGPFLGKSVSGPARAKVLGKLAGTEEIDFAGKEVGTDLYRAKRQQEGLEKDVKGLDEQIGKYGFIPGWERVAGQAEVMLADTRAKITEIEKLKSLSQQWQELSAKVSTLKQVIQDLKQVHSGLDLVRGAQEQLTKGNTLAELRAKHFGAKVGCEGSKRTLERLGQTIEAISPIMDALGQGYAHILKCEQLQGEYEYAKKLVNSYSQTTKRLASIGQADDHLRHAFNDNVQLSRLDALYDQHERAEQCVISYSRLANLYTNIEQADGPIRQAWSDSLQLFRIKELLKNQESLAEKVRQLNDEVVIACEVVIAAQTDYQLFMNNLGRCPVCGSEIDSKKLLEVV